MQTGIHLRNLKGHSTATVATASKNFKHANRPAAIRRRSSSFSEVLPFSRGMNLVATWPVGGEAVMMCFTPTLPTIR